MEHRLEAKSLSVAFGGVKAVREVSFKVSSNEIIGVIGPNGAGKTTLFNIISGFVIPTSGQILLDEKDLTGKRPDLIAREGLVRTFQATKVFEGLTVLDNLVIAQHLVSVGKNIQSLKDKAFEIMTMFDLEAYSLDIVKNLPYGIKKILGISLGIAASAKFLLLDEPVAGLNQTEASKIRISIKKVHENGIGILIIEHHMEFLMKLANRVIVLDAGIKIAEGSPDNVTRNPDVIQAYMGGKASA